jgi:MoxR-like ATPase
VSRVVELVRRTRTHPDLRVGSSVRGALDATAVVASLSSLRGRPATSVDVGLDAVLVALSGRVRLREGCTRTAEEIITELWFEVFGGDRPDGAEGDGDAAGKATAPAGASPS